MRNVVHGFSMARRIALSIAVVASMACSPSAISPSAISPSALANQECLGRFRLQIPKGLKVLYTKFSIYGTIVRTEPLSEQGASANWAREFERLQLDKDVQQKTIKPFLLNTGAQGVWYETGQPPHSDAFIKVATPVGTQMVWAFRDFLVPKLSVAQTLTNDIVSEFHLDTRSGFCIGNGAIRKKSLSESAHMRLGHIEHPDFTIEMKTQTVSRPSKAGQDLDEEKDFAKVTGSTFTKLRDRSRRVAGLNGQEYFRSIKLPHESEALFLTWAYEGIPSSAEAPSVVSSSRVDAKHRKDLENAWDTMLNSIGKIPLLPEGPKPEVKVPEVPKKKQVPQLKSLPPIAIQVTFPNSKMSLGGPMPLEIQVKNLQAKTLVFKEPQRVWEFQMAFQNRSNENIQLPFGRLTHSSEGKDVHRVIVEEAKDIQLSSEEKHSFDFDAGLRWPERFVLGRQTLQVVSLQFDGFEISSNKFEIFCVYDQGTFPRLVSLASKSDATLDERTFAFKGMAMLDARFTLDLPKDGSRARMERELLKQAEAWWKAEREAPGVIANIEKLNKAAQ